MKNNLIGALTILVALAACGGSDRDKAAEQAEFETVQEGSAAGVTSTIAGPGETIPPMTGTNADTTTAFALNTNPVQATQPAGTTIAGSLPVDPYGTPPPMTGTYRPPVATRPAPVRTQPTPPPAATQTAEPAPPTDTATTTTTTTTQPPPTDTTPPPPSAEDDAEEPEETTTAPPPPPPAT